MSFGTFNLYNFFQSPNTGVTPAPGTYDVTSIVEGVGESGNIADFNWPFPYAGTSVPIEIVEGVGGAFQLKLFSDSYVGLRFASVNEVFSGQLQGDSENSHSSTTISGTFNPMDSGFQNSYVVFSGLISGAPQDSPVNYIVLSGVITDQHPDFGLPFLVFSGQSLNDQPNISDIGYTISGTVSDADYSNPTLNITFSGTFIPTNQDTANISYGFYGMATYNNVTVTSTGFINSANIKYGFASFISTRGA